MKASKYNFFCPCDKENNKYINCFLAIYDGELNLSGINALVSPEIAEINEGGIYFDKASWKNTTAIL